MSDATSTKPAPWFQPTWWALLTCLLAWLVLVGGAIMRLWHKGFEENDFALAGGAIIGGLVVIGFFYGLCILLALIARKSRLALSITLTILAGFSAFGNSFSIVRIAGTTNERLAEQLELEAQSVLDALEQLQIQDVQAGQSLTNHEAMRQHAGMLRDIAAQFKGDEGDHHKITARYLENSAQAWEDYNTALTRLHDYWITTPSWALEQEDMGLGEAAILQLQRSNERVYEFFTNPSDSVKLCFSQEGIDNDLIRREMTAGVVRAKKDIQPMLDMRGSDRKLSLLLLDIHRFLDANWHDWEYSEDEDQMYLATDALIAEYNLLIERLDAITKEQVAIQQRALQEK